MGKAHHQSQLISPMGMFVGTVICSAAHTLDPLQVGDMENNYGGSFNVDYSLCCCSI